MGIENIEYILEEFDHSINDMRKLDVEHTWREEIFNEAYYPVTQISDILVQPLEQLKAARVTLDEMTELSPIILENLKRVANSGNCANFPVDWYSPESIKELHPEVLMDYVDSITNSYAKFIKHTDNQDLEDDIDDLEDPVIVRRFRASLARTSMNGSENSSKFISVMIPKQVIVTNQFVRNTMIPSIVDFQNHSAKDKSESRYVMNTTYTSFDKLLKMTKDACKDSAHKLDRIVDAGMRSDTDRYRTAMNRRFFDAAIRTYIEGCKYLIGALGAYYCMWIGNVRAMDAFVSTCTTKPLDIKPYTESLANDLDGFDSATFAPLINAAKNLKQSMTEIDIAFGTIQDKYPAPEYMRILEGLGSIENGVTSAINYAINDGYIADDIIKMSKIGEADVDKYLNLDGFEVPKTMKTNLGMHPDSATIFELTMFITYMETIANGINYLREVVNKALVQIEQNVNHAFDAKNTADVLRITLVSIQDKLGDFSRNLYEKASSRLEAINQVVTGKALLNFKSIRMDCSPRFHSEIFTAINEEAEDEILELNKKYSNLYMKKLLGDKTYLEDNTQPQQTQEQKPAAQPQQTQPQSQPQQNQDQKPAENQNQNQQNQQNQTNNQNQNQNNTNNDGKKDKKSLFQSLKDAITQFMQDMANRVNGEEGKKNKGFLNKLVNSDFFNRTFSNITVEMPAYLKNAPIQILVDVAMNVSNLQEDQLRGFDEKKLFEAVFRNTGIKYKNYTKPKDGASFNDEVYRVIQVGDSGTLNNIRIMNSAIRQWVKPMWDFLNDYYNGNDLSKLEGMQNKAFSALDRFLGLTPNNDRLDQNLNLVKTWVSTVTSATQKAIKDRKNEYLQTLANADGGKSNTQENQGQGQENGQNGNQPQNQNQGQNGNQPQNQNQSQNGTQTT